MKNILWLTSWYPNAMDPFNGDFIQRQAEAVSDYQSLKIVYVGKYPSGTAPIKINPVVTQKGNHRLEEYILYYPSYANGYSILSRFLSFNAYFKRHFEFLSHLRKGNEFPDIIHVQVAMKAGLIALYLKWRYKIPFVLTEHWSGYYAESRDSLFKKSYLTRYLTRLIIKNASRFLPVSEALGNQIAQHWIPVSFLKIPNVVNARYFYPSENNPPAVFRFIHISSLSYPKNPEGIIRAFIKLLKQGIRAELVLVGPENPDLNEFIRSSALTTEQLYRTGEISYEQVGIELRKSSSLVMFSFYENMPCVILEALCTGIPVIATSVGGIPEVIHTNNGLLINTGSESELLEAMKKMIQNHSGYDREKISHQSKEQFSYQVVGQKIIDVYNSVHENK
jgi:glycosyltransferase involved in cell wall biosynthesis